MDASVNRISRLLRRQVPPPAQAGHRRDFLLAMLPRGSRGAEVGVHLGDFSAHILAEVEPSELHLIDPWMYQPEPDYDRALYGGKAAGQAEMDDRYQSVVDRFADGIAHGSVIVHRGFSTDVLETFPDGYNDWI
jgi:hypothetical protein